MSKKIYVGNLSYSTTSDDLQNEFSDCGEIEKVQLITDRETCRSKGFAFITFIFGVLLLLYQRNNHCCYLYQYVVHYQ